MRLAEIDRGDRLTTRLVFTIASALSGSRLPDAARAAMYHRRFAGPILNAWAHEVMRGPGSWTIGERELMAALVASWNSCPFCVGAHRAVAVHGMPSRLVDAALADHRTAALPPNLAATLVFLEAMTLRPQTLTAEDAQSALTAGASPEGLREAADVAAVFNIVTRYANALDFAVPSPAAFAKAAPFLLRRGYK